MNLCSDCRTAVGAIGKHLGKNARWSKAAKKDAPQRVSGARPELLAKWWSEGNVSHVMSFKSELTSQVENGHLQGLHCELTLISLADESRIAYLTALGSIA